MVSLLIIFAAPYFRRFRFYNGWHWNRIVDRCYHANCHTSHTFSCRKFIIFNVT